MTKEKLIWTSDQDGLDLEGRLEEHFGYSEFKPGQKEVIRSLMTGKDVLWLAGTGEGKSLCAHYVAMVRERVWLVVEPLKVIIDDQVAGLQARGIPAFGIHSDNSQEERQSAKDAVIEDRARLLFVAPERLQNSWFMHGMDRVDLDGVLVDELHKVFQDKDSRSAYPQLGHFVNHWRNVKDDSLQVAGCTATLTPESAEYVRRMIPFREGETVEYDFGVERDNLKYEIYSCADDEEKLMRVAPMLKQSLNTNPPKPVLIYCTTIKKVNWLIEKLSEEYGISAESYHGRMKADHKKEAAERFKSNESLILVATDAFGMGFHKNDIREVIHFDPPGDVLTYRQQTGRGGRDGEEANCRMFASPRDFETYEYFMRLGLPKLEFVEEVYKAIKNHTRDLKDLPKGVKSFNRSGFYRSFTAHLGANNYMQKYAIKRAVDEILNLFIEYNLLDVFNGCIRLAEFESDEEFYRTIYDVLRHRVKMEMASLNKMKRLVHEAFMDVDAQMEGRADVYERNMVQSLNSPLDFEGLEYLDQEGE